MGGSTAISSEVKEVFANEGPLVKYPRSMARSTRASVEEEREGMSVVGMVVTVWTMTSFRFNHFFAPSLLGLLS